MSGAADSDERSDFDVEEPSVTDPDELPETDPEALPEVGSRRDRLVAYLRYNRDRLVVDVAVLLAWMIGSTAVFQAFGLPRWLHYLVLFLGVVVYSRVTSTWHRPYRSPD